MDMISSFNRQSLQTRQIALDIKLSDAKNGVQQQIIEIAALELRSGRATGVEFHVVMSETPDQAKILQSLRRFIGENDVVINTQSVAGKVHEIDSLNRAFVGAEVGVVPDQQWTNLRKMSDKVFGAKTITLEKMLDKYGVTSVDALATEDRALRDARLVAGVFKLLSTDYAAVLSQQEKANATKQPQPQPQNQPQTHSG